MATWRCMMWRPSARQSLESKTGTTSRRRLARGIVVDHQRPIGVGHGTLGSIRLLQARVQHALVEDKNSRRRMRASRILSKY